ncbi:hypothetical protein H7K45_28700 [Mycobacterium yunnanensis]|uniref:Uncharacterized protein n=1 Tax=Mycobacterium yunnanensis TaxID=368477 RepID=A0A9X2Z8F0_9MYCO|nr:hypothetical protein [Mycobacterium yunnanensis]MCV7424529.1 hypothetical protein [Mycobacterium yunnanensis]
MTTNITDQRGWRRLAIAGGLMLCAAAAMPAVYANADDYTYVHTQSGATRCSIGDDTVLCQGLNADLPAVGIGHDSAMVTANGDLTFTSVGMVGAPADDTVLHYGQTYHYHGWTILPSDQGTRFTNDRYGHGMFVSIQHVDSF